MEMITITLVLGFALRLALPAALLLILGSLVNGSGRRASV